MPVESATDTPPVGTGASPSIAEGSGRPQVSAWRAIAYLVATGAICISAYSNSDPDIYWHRILGQSWLDTGSLSLHPDPIAFTAGRPWYPTSWATDVLYAGLVDVGGWPAVPVLRFALALAIFALLGRFLFRNVSPAAACGLFAGIGFPLALVIQDRPQTVSFAIVCAILPNIRSALVADELPPWWAAPAFTWLWANVHGLWILVPGLLGVFCVFRLVERKASWRAAALGAVTSVAAAALTPVGPELLLTPWRISAAASGAIDEWTPTALRHPGAWGFAVVLLTILLLALKGWTPRPRETAYVVAMTLFGFWASRNAPLAALLLVPAVVSAFSPPGAPRPHDILVPRLALVVALPVLALAAGSTYVLHAGVPAELPHTIAQHLGQRSGAVRVVAPYNVGGFLREFSGDDVRVSIDGRADRYGAAEIRRQSDMQAGRRGWQVELRRLRPDVVITPSRSALRELLERDGWKVTTRDHGFVMLDRRAS